jgi:hypothetical protein
MAALPRALIGISDGRSTGALTEQGLCASAVLIRKWVRKTLVINPIPRADPFARNLATLLGARHFTAE